MATDPLDGVAVFVETVRAGSFARAAQQLAVTRSAVGKSIARLEERLQVRLFHRSTRSLSLTEDGRLYHESCQRALQMLGAAESLLDSGRKEVTGRLRVTAPVLFGSRCVAPVLLAWAAKHPGLTLEMSLTDRTMDLLADGFDLGVRGGPLRPDGALRARRLLSLRKVLCAAPAYLQRRGTPRQIDDLHDHEHLVYRRGDYVQPLRFETAQGLVEWVPQGRIHLDDLPAIVDAAVAGMGLAWVPAWQVQQELASGQLVPLLPQHRSVPMELHAVWAADGPMPLRLRQAVDELVEALPGRVQV